MIDKKIGEDKAAENKKEIKIPKAEVKLRQAVKRLANTSDGQILFRFLMQECGHNQSSIVMNQTTTEINEKATIYMEARKTVYYQLRKLIPDESLKIIEFTSIDKMED